MKTKCGNSSSLGEDDEGRPYLNEYITNGEKIVFLGSTRQLIALLGDVDRSWWRDFRRGEEAGTVRLLRTTCRCKASWKPFFLSRETSNCSNAFDATPIRLA